MAQVTSSNVTVFFDYFGSLVGSGGFRNKYDIRIRITNNNATAVTIQDLYVFFELVGRGMFSDDGSDLYVIPGNTVELEFQIFKESETDDWFAEGDPVEGRVRFKELGEDFRAPFDLVTKADVVEVNTGYKAWTTLEEYQPDTGLATGNTKPNDPEDPDYVGPVYDTDYCPLP